MNNDNSSMDFYERPQPKKSKGSTFIIIILLLVIIGMGGYIAYDKGYLDSILKKDNKTEQKVEEKEPTTTNELKEITDQNIIKTLDRNVEILNLMSDSTWLDKSEVFAKDQKNADLKDGIKVNAILTYIEKDENYAGKVSVTYDDLKRIGLESLVGDKKPSELTEDDFDEIEGAKSETVNELFKSVYGYEPKDFKEHNSCPARYYDSTSQKYISVARCGGTCGEQTLTYNYKYEEDEKNAYVYTALAVEKCADAIYKDYDAKEVFEKIDVESDKEFKLDKTNYEQFSKYKITFNKSGSNYVFDSIELLK